MPRNASKCSELRVASGIPCLLVGMHPGIVLEFRTTYIDVTCTSTSDVWCAITVLRPGASSCLHLVGTDNFISPIWSLSPAGLKRALTIGAYHRWKRCYFSQIARHRCGPQCFACVMRCVADPYTLFYHDPQLAGCEEMPVQSSWTKPRSLLFFVQEYPRRVKIEGQGRHR